MLSILGCGGGLGPGCFFGTVCATHCVTRGACAQRVVCVAAGGTTPRPSGLRVHCQNAAPEEGGGLSAPCVTGAGTTRCVMGGPGCNFGTVCATHCVMREHARNALCAWRREGQRLVQVASGSIAKMRRLRRGAACQRLVSRGRAQRVVSMGGQRVGALGRVRHNALCHGEALCAAPCVMGEPCAQRVVLRRRACAQRVVSRGRVCAQRVVSWGRACCAARCVRGAGLRTTRCARGACAQRLVLQGGCCAQRVCNALCCAQRFVVLGGLCSTPCFTGRVLRNNALCHGGASCAARCVTEAGLCATRRVSGAGLCAKRCVRGARNALCQGGGPVRNALCHGGGPVRNASCHGGGSVKNTKEA